MKSKQPRNRRGGGAEETPGPPASSRRGLPFVLVNMSMTADGKIATANREVSSFGSRRDHEHLLDLRASADAVLCGARTVDLNQVSLGTGGKRLRKLRLKRGLAQCSVRVIATGSGSLDPKAHIFLRRANKKSDGPIIVLTTARAGKQRLAKLCTVADEVKICGRKELNFHEALRWLYKEWNVCRLICEGGGELNDAMFRANLVDELHLTLCPKIIGGRQAPTIVDGVGFKKLPIAKQLQLVSARRVDDELFLVYRSCTLRH